jgi:hypothetical protein
MPIEHPILDSSVMTALNHITAGRTAIRVLLVAVVLAGAIAGTVGTAAAEPMDGKGDDPYPPALYSLDGKGNDVYPPPSVYASRETAEVVDRTTNDVVTYDFLATYVGRGGGSGKPSF